MSDQTEARKREIEESIAVLAALGRIEPKQPQPVTIDDGYNTPETFPCMIDAMKGKSVFRRMEDEMGIGSRAKPGLFYFVDGCDLYYVIGLTPDQLRQLGRELIALADTTPHP